MQQITDHASEAQARLLSQFQSLPRLTSLFAIFSEQVQVVENAIYQTYLATPLVNAVGAQLDNIGGIVGLARNGLDDATYKVLLKATIALNNSDATTDAVLSLVEQVFESAFVWVQTPNTGAANKLATPALLSLQICDPGIPLSLKPTLLKILQAAMPSGVMLSQVDLTTAEGNKTFAFAGDGPHIAGFDSGAYCTPFYANPLD